MANKNTPVKSRTQLYKERDEKYYDKFTLKGKKPLRAMIEKAVEAAEPEMSINKFILNLVYERLESMGITEESIKTEQE